MQVSLALIFCVLPVKAIMVTASDLRRSECLTCSTELFVNLDDLVTVCNAISIGVSCTYIAGIMAP